MNVEYILLSDNFTRWRDKINNLISKLSNFDGIPDMSGKEDYVLSNDGNSLQWIDISDNINSNIDDLKNELSGKISELENSISNINSVVKPTGVLKNSVLTYNGSNSVWQSFPTFFSSASSNYTISGTMKAKTFSGTLNGNASTATKATQDANGNNIENTYYKKTGGPISGDVSISGDVDVTGDLVAENVYNAVWNDYAEFFPRGEETEPGDIISLDINSKKEQYVKASLSKYPHFVGVHSDTYGHLIGGEKNPDGTDFVEYNIAKFIPVGLTGRVRTKVMCPVKKGDYIVLSDIPGVGKVYFESVNSDKEIVGLVCEDCEESGIHRVLTLLK